MTSPAAGTVRIERCAGQEQAGAIKALFARNGRPTFAAFFDRAYRAAIRQGGASWVAFEAGGEVVAHLAAFPRPFGDGTQALRGALLGDLMADAAHRNFWTPLALLRRAVTDLTADGLDFLYSDPTPPAEAVVRAAGFAPLAVLRRWAAPLVPPYVWWQRMRRGALGLAVEAVPPDDGSVGTALATWRSSGLFRAERRPEEYGARLPGDRLGACTWLVVRDARNPCGVAAVSQSEPGLLLVADLLWDGGKTDPARLLTAVFAWARRAGFRRLAAHGLDGSWFAGALRRAGLFARADSQPMVVRPLAAVVPPADRWFLTVLDGSAW